MFVLLGFLAGFWLTAFFCLLHPTSRSSHAEQKRGISSVSEIFRFYSRSRGRLPKKTPKPNQPKPQLQTLRVCRSEKSRFRGVCLRIASRGAHTGITQILFYFIFFSAPHVPRTPPCSPRPAPPPRGEPAGQNGGEGRGHAWGGEGGTVPVFPVITEPGARSFAFCPRLPQIRIGLKMYFLGKIKFKNKLRAGSVGRSGTVGGSPGRTKRAAAFRTRGDRAEKKSPEIRAGNEC